jgi:acid stress-induced BolA-like protein IbaG/YrbA
VEAGDIQTLLSEHIPDSEAKVRVEGSHVHLLVVSARFEGLNTLKRQQLIYGALNQSIADGRIHAVHMKTYTPVEWQQAQS